MLENTVWCIKAHQVQTGNTPAGTARFTIMTAPELMETEEEASMADFVFNIAKGRVVELYNRVDTNDPANSALVLLVLAVSGIETDATLKDKDDVSALLSGTTNEVTNTGYARKVLTDADLVAFAPDDVNDRVDLDIPDQTWTGVQAGDNWSDLVIAYDSDTTGGTDANIVPLTQQDFAVTPDGTNITAQINSAGFYRAS